jgi:hypothetical protein
MVPTSGSNFKCEATMCMTTDVEHVKARGRSFELLGLRYLIGWRFTSQHRNQMG